jgi:hypothetical protein
VQGRKIKPFGTLRDLPIVLATFTRCQSCKLLKQILANESQV